MSCFAVSPHPDITVSEPPEPGELSRREVVFTDLYRNWSGELRAYVSRRAGGADLVDDIVAEAFLRAWRQVRDTGSTGQGHDFGWLTTIAMRLILDHQRRARTRTGVGDAERILALVADSSPGPAELAEAAAMSQLVREAVDRLPEHLAGPVRDCRLGTLSQSDASTAYGVNQGSISKRISRAMQMLADDPVLRAAC